MLELTTDAKSFPFIQIYEGVCRTGIILYIITSHSIYILHYMRQTCVLIRFARSVKANEVWSNKSGVNVSAVVKLKCCVRTGPRVVVEAVEKRVRKKTKINITLILIITITWVLRIQKRDEWNQDSFIHNWMFPVCYLWNDVVLWEYQHWLMLPKPKF